jgi:hypothetical protein
VPGAGIEWVLGERRGLGADKGLGVDMECQGEGEGVGEGKEVGVGMEWEGVDMVWEKEREWVLI